MWVTSGGRFFSYGQVYFGLFLQGAANRVGGSCIRTLCIPNTRVICRQTQASSVGWGHAWFRKGRVERVKRPKSSDCSSTRLSRGAGWAVVSLPSGNATYRFWLSPVQLLRAAGVEDNTRGFLFCPSYAGADEHVLLSAQWLSQPLCHCYVLVLGEPRMGPWFRCMLWFFCTGQTTLVQETGLETWQKGSFFQDATPSTLWSTQK